MLPEETYAPSWVRSDVPRQNVQRNINWYSIENQKVKTIADYVLSRLRIGNASRN